MNNNIQHHQSFESIKKINDHNSEYWSARDLAKTLSYNDWRNFVLVINKAMEACKNSGQSITDHFGEITEMVNLGSGAKREIENYNLSRYACYLIIQNADPSKEIVAAGQTYFATQTRKQEIIEQEFATQTEAQKRLMLREEMKTHNKNLASAVKGAGVIDPFDYAIFQDHGYKGLYGGLGSKDIHKQKSLKKSQQILDHMGSTELAANLFRATQTEEKLKRENIKGKQNANMAHYEVGKKVRQAIKDIGGTMPEKLPVAEDIKKIERQEIKKQKALEKQGNE